MTNPIFSILTAINNLSSKPRKNDEITSKLPEYGDCLLSTTLFP